jgi:type IV pilus assembly protein PilV
MSRDTGFDSVDVSRSRARRPAAAGFSLIEVMVALIVLSVGLLGIARMQSLALSSTTVASQRSMAAIEAESLAAALHANRGYWTTADPAGATITIQGATFNVAGGAAALLAAQGTAPCISTASPCTPAALAAYDLLQWAAVVNSPVSPLLPNSTTTIACGAVTPISCSVTISWSENTVAVNVQEATAAAAAITNGTTAAIQVPTYMLYVEP